LVLSGGVARWGLAFSLLGRLNSGLPFTPIVGSDINGDGFANDRAFIYHRGPATGSPAVPDLSALLASGSRQVRRCLERQFGRPAERNSCEGPWTSAMNAQLTAQGGRLHLPKTINSISLNFTNPLGGLDQLLHGASGLRGWGTQPFADPVLYNVRAFDPAGLGFVYEVNPRFGTTRPAQNTLRAPFRVTLDVSMSLGRPATVQQLERWLLGVTAGLDRSSRPTN